MKLYAQHIMSTDLITVRPEMLCEEVIELFLANHISGAPVVNPFGVLIGVITMTDILKSGQAYTQTESPLEDARLSQILSEEGFHMEVVPGGFASDFMTPQPFTAFPHTPIEELAAQMYTHRVHRLIIVQSNEQKPVGIVTTFDLLKLIATADALKAQYDTCCCWYERKFSQVPYETIPTLK
jgi:predicted transcriptional regulator